jgi:hypothetical protein
MSTRPRKFLPLVLVPGALLFAACDGDEPPTGPAVDAVPPVVSLTATETCRTREAVTLSWTASDDVALSAVSVSWGTPGSGPESVPVSGPSHTGSFTHTYGETGAYTILLEATDAAGNRASATRDISVVEPDPAAPDPVAADPEAPVLDRGPVLTRFSAVAAEPTCLQLEWWPSLWRDPADGEITWRDEAYRVEIRGTAPGAGFEALVPHWPKEATFCADSYPIEDGETYAAQLFALIGDAEFPSDERTFTTDFEPFYTLTGTWQGEYWAFADHHLTLELVEENGEISGTWTDPSFHYDESSNEMVFERMMSGPVTGTRTYAAVTLVLEPGDDNESGNLLTVEFLEPDRLEGYCCPPLVGWVVLERD